ncbi:MAG TPA: zinc metallopeptidase [Clostridiaceae bacterium]|nr:zinc metallopeptidase [Clostridiaceae bacterium]
MGWQYLFFIIGMSLSLFAQLKVRSSFNKYGKVLSRSGYTGFQAARRALDENGLWDVQVERVGGTLTDHYSPREKILRLSDATHDSRSVAAIGVALHEVGHAMQDKEGYVANKIRSALLLPANIGSQFGPILAMIGLMMQSMLGDALLNVGIAFFAASVLFYLVTLPVEFNASRRAMALISQTGVLADDEMTGARSVLSAAALTYVASALTAVLYLLRFILMASSSRRRR